MSSELHKKYTENSDTNDKNKRKNTNKERHVHEIKEWVNKRLQLGNTDEDVAKSHNPPKNASQISRTESELDECELDIDRNKEIYCRHRAAPTPNKLI